jgi:hypothetical protein
LASLATRQAEATAAATSLSEVTKQLDAVSGQITAVAPLVPHVEELITRTELLARDSSAIRVAAAGVSQQTAAAPMTLPLPTTLGLPGPLSGLLETRRGAADARPGTAGLGGNARSAGASPTPVVLPNPAGIAATPSAVTEATPAVGSSRDHARTARHARYGETETRQRASPLPAAEPAAPPVPDGPVGGGATAPSGGTGTGASAAAVLALAAGWLLAALLPGRLPLDRFPWRSPLLTSRLERPG